MPNRPAPAANGRRVSPPPRRPLRPVRPVPFVSSVSLNVTVPTRNPALPGLVLALVNALALAACDGGPGASPEAAESGLKKRELPSVRVAPVVVREMARVLETTSKLESEREIELMPRLAGVVLSLSAEEGDAVDQGETLAQLDDE